MLFQFVPDVPLFISFGVDCVDMGFYEVNLGILVALNSLLFYRQRRVSRSTHNLNSDLEDDADEELKDLAAEPDTRVADFVKQYLAGHLLAYAADWLQVRRFHSCLIFTDTKTRFPMLMFVSDDVDESKGPHLYAVYKYDKKLAETYVAALYATGFVSAALSSAFAGQLADRFGRKRACLVYCASYTACCLSVLSDNLYILFAGRFCGGVSTTLLFSVFDAWMNAEYRKRGLQSEHLSLSTLYAWLTSLTSIVAITTGIIGEILVSLTGTKTSPFLLAALVLVCTAAWISSTWVSRMTLCRDSFSLLKYDRVKITATSQMIFPRPRF